MNKYMDIIDLEHYEPKKHMRMSMINRAAQFAPFAALTGYEDAVSEVGRLTNKKIILSDDELVIINERIMKIKEKINDLKNVKITYFIADLYKDGGRYEVKEGEIRRIDESGQMIVMKDKTMIKMCDIIEIEY